MYSITIQLRKGNVKEIVIQASSHTISENELFSIIGSDKRRYLIPLSNIAYVEFDKKLDEIIVKMQILKPEEVNKKKIKAD